MSGKKIAISVFIFLLIAASISAVYGYRHYCQRVLEEVDSYALPQVIEFMEVLSEWDLEKLKPYLADSYFDSLTAEEWQEEFEILSVLGELKSFARPNFVSHVGYKKYKICESAIDMYSVASEYEKDNAVVRIIFNNDCGKLSVISFLVNSRSIVHEPEFLKESTNKENGEVIEDELSLDELEDEEAETDLDAIYEEHKESELMKESEDKNISNTKPKPSKNNTPAKKPQGKAYRY